ncbi:MAG: YdjY domain-containing protein [Thermoguttaceae bacterium]
MPGKLVHLEAGPTVGAPGTLGQGRVYVCGGDAGVLCVDLNRVLVKDKEQDLNAALANTERRWTELLNKYEQDKQQDATKAIPPTEAALTIPVPKLLWQQGQGKWHIDAPPLVVGDYLLAASAYLDDEKIGKRCLVCLKTTDGSLVWETPLEINPWAGPSVAGRSVLVGCSSIRFDRKLLGGAKGEVVSLDLATGKVRWREAAPGGVLSPVAVKGEAAVFTTTGGQVVARHCGTGRLLWKYEAGRPFFAGPAVAADTVYAADLKNVLHAIRLADGQRQWTLDVAGDQSVQAKGMVFGSPLVHGGDIYLATCNLDADTDDPSVIVCLSDKAAAGSAALPVIVEKERRRISVPCKVAPRKLAWLNAVYPLEVVATYPTPRGQKAHETVVTFECKPSEIHRALESFGLKPGKPARGDDEPATGPELRLYLELPGIGGKPDVVPLEKTMIDKRTGKPLPPLKWCFTGSVGRQIDPEKEDTVYGADLSGTMITIYPVTDETVCQGNLTMREGSLLALEVNKNLLPEEGAELRLIIEAK